MKKLIAMFVIMACRELKVELETQKEKQEKALAEIKTLTGILPICASCKNIRDDKGYWNEIEAYIRDHSEAELSHSVCPECAKKLYPGFGLAPKNQTHTCV